MRSLVSAGLLAALVACGVRRVDPDSGEVVVLQGNTHRLARAENDSGPTDKSLAMDRMILTLRIADSKKAELAQLLAEQQDPASPNYHRWLTPEEFGTRFGPSSEEIARVTGWLAAQGFAVDEVAKGRTWINFSGVVGAVEAAFRTQIRNYSVGNKLRHANAVDPSIPAELASVVAGVVTLHNFPRVAMNTGLKPVSDSSLASSVQPQHTDGSTHAMSPGDFAIIYNVNALYAAGIDGTGQSIAIVGRTHPPETNWTTFRSSMGLPANPIQLIINGTDPGDIGADEDGEADLDVEWSGAVAKNATIKFVISASTAVTDGVDLSAQYIVDNNVAPVMSTSFGLCEGSMSASENSFYSNLWSQAAAQGITSFVASGDSGAAGCDGGNSASGSGQAVSGLASTPFNVAVGGTQFNEGSGTYWSASNSSFYTSALSYIPEIAWNESGSVSEGAGLWATGGGASGIYSKPSWQVGPGVPADGKRDVPDVSLSGAGHDGYLVRTSGDLYSIGGTSASSPAFAGLMALINQKTGTRQGNANVRFYQLGAAQYGSTGPVVFHDTTSGSNTVPGTEGYSCAVGYDLATGLGSVDAFALVNNWATTPPSPDFTFWAWPSSLSVAQGGSGAVTLTTSAYGGFNSAVSLSASGLPAGATAEFNPAVLAAPGGGTSTLTVSLGATTAGGTYSISVTAAGGGATRTVTIPLVVTYSISGTVSLNGSGLAGVTVAAGNASAKTDASGAYSIPGLPNGTYTVVPSLSDYTFSPANRSVAMNDANVSGVDFGASEPVTLFSDGFEGSGWSTAQISGTAGIWTLAASGARPAASPHRGAKLAAFNSYTSRSGSQTRLYRRSGFAIPSNATGATLKFWMYHDTGYISNHDRVQVQVSTNGSTWTNAGSAASRNNGTTGWAQVSVDLSAFKGQSSLQLGFLGISSYGNDVYLDDVTVTAN